ncbi:hypothetical protein [Methylobacterium persicinum]|uniref:Uncharacterized protein n=1 Tax=Methylobacterium persicinum TaxID=374426 RepID=A0ABU0HJZ0_9HYPH|nr:hypothetical protein [Methylobacterium persicinum]MDQ0442639.1 hypothetical protein [Methylobacterium persicinum]
MMSLIEVQPQAALGEADEAVLVASAVRAGIDAVLTERAPAERDAFWHAVALLYARGSKPVGRTDTELPAPPSDALEPSMPTLETTR